MMMRDCLRKMMALSLLAIFVAWPRHSEAGIMDLAKGVADWWSVRSVGVHTLGDDADASGEDDFDAESGGEGESDGDGDEDVPDEETGDGDQGDSEADDDTGPSTGALPGKCQVPQEPPVTECSIGSGFLCVSTPLGGVAESSFVLRGTIDRQSSTLASVQIIAQNEYTKEISSVDTSAPAISGCAEGESFQGDYCLDQDGHYAARITLSEDGPYTVSVTASRLSGDSVTKQVRISRVIATNLTDDDVSFNPDVKAQSSIDATHVTVTVDLLGECQFCDFIGASTGGVRVTVDNMIVDSSGENKTISCSTTVEQGGQGKFILGVPVGSGQNSLKVRACNAAASGSGCPSAGSVTFDATGVVDVSDSFEFISPDPRPSYDSEEFPKIPWKFRFVGGESCITARINREKPLELCPDSEGVYSTDIEPRVGINVVSLASGSGADEFAWTFGWGRILSPHVSEDGRIEIPSGVEIGLTANATRDMIVPALNNYLSSDEFASMLDEVLGGIGGGDSAMTSEDESPVSIPKCGANGGGNFSSELRGKPVIGSVRIKSPEFAKDKLGLVVVIKDTEIGIDLIPEKNLPPLPLVISFRKALLDVELVVEKTTEGEPRILLSSPHDDCDYKSGTYCKHIPAPLIPKNIVGGANSYGSFIKCEMGLAKGKAKEACSAINSLNAQTGILSELVLDALNEAIYCSGSAALTRAAREGIDIEPFTLDFGGGGRTEARSKSIVPRVRIPLGIEIWDGLGISNKGVVVDAGLSFGDDATYANTPDEARIDSAGIIASDGMGSPVLVAPGDLGGDLDVALSLDAVNAFLFVASAQGDGGKFKGLLDFDIHEPFFNDLDFDFVEECDEYVIPPGEEDETSTLCQIRPRVSTLLGTALTTYGYLEGNHPLMMAARGNRALGPRISVASLSDLPVVIYDEEGDAAGGSTPAGSLLSIDIGGLTLSFYALEVDEAAGIDEYGNPALALDADGNPVIMSMLPDNPDPWKGQIISFDLTLMLALEVGSVGKNPEDESSFLMSVGVLGDRSRLVLTPIPGTNTTTVPSAGLVSSLTQKLKYAVAELESFDIPIPREIALEADDDGIFGMLGLAKVGFGEDGLSLDFDEERNKALLAVSAIIEQILHVNGEEKEYTLP